MRLKYLSDDELVTKLNAHPELRARLTSVLLAVEDEMGELQEADTAELCLIKEIRQMGRESLSAWAQGQVSRATAECCQDDSVWREGKKNCAGTPPSATSAWKNPSCVAAVKGYARSRIGRKSIIAACPARCSGS